MKIKSLKLRLSDFFKRGIHGGDSSDTMLEWVKLESERESAEALIKDILRWADDGGKMLDLGNRTARSDPDTARKQANEVYMSAEKAAK